MPASVHYEAVKCIFKYLRSTINDGLHVWRICPNYALPNATNSKLRPDNSPPTIPPSQPFKPNAFSDSNWAANIGHRRSVSGSSVFLAGAPIIYGRKFQYTVALSSTEAEFYAACDTEKHVRFVRSIFKYLNIELSHPTLIYDDNEAAITVSKNKRTTRHLRYVDLRHFAILYWVQNGDIQLLYILSSSNPADALTKTLGSTFYYRHSDTLLGKRPQSYYQF